MLKAIVHKINHEPLMYLKGENTHLGHIERINTIRNVFGLK